MPEVILQDDPFVIVGTDGKKYTIADPLDFMMSLAGENLLGENGTTANNINSIAQIRQKLISACGIPDITYPNVLRTLQAIGDFAQGLQKKIGSTPNSLPPTDDSHPTNPNELVST